MRLFLKTTTKDNYICKTIKLLFCNVLYNFNVLKSNFMQTAKNKLLFIVFYYCKENPFCFVHFQLSIPPLTWVCSSAIDAGTEGRRPNLQGEATFPTIQAFPDNLRDAAICFSCLER